jgi:hypothetical protein
VRVQTRVGLRGRSIDLAFNSVRYVLDYERVTAAVWDSFAHTIDFSERDGGDEAHDTGRHWKLGNVVASRDRM